MLLYHYLENRRKWISVSSRPHSGLYSVTLSQKMRDRESRGGSKGAQKNHYMKIRVDTMEISVDPSPWHTHIHTLVH